MAKEPEEEEILEAKPGLLKNKPMLLIIIISVAFLFLMGGGFYFLWHKVTPEEPKTEQKKDEVKEEKDEVKPMYALTPFIVNLADQDVTRYMRITMELELAGEETTAEVEKRLPQIRDAILTIIPSKTAKDISSVEGKTALRDEIIQRLNSFIKKGKITNIYFTEFVIQ
ncbi:Flagellar protein FliL [uncultured Desulfobacterium sp.]|uniref:Flagellar protein FliL n=1 Tax=uncultured Desulfobacterium sp. TaxID=201089 RepID=A0A445MX00_9BACT|nr:Flagellar protein FliL [uncultured Desulfobacterium sp.]